MTGTLLFLLFFIPVAYLMAFASRPSFYSAIHVSHLSLSLSPIFVLLNSRFFVDEAMRVVIATQL
jgi:hypothetical protein